ncbi:hypothetical protein OAO85_04675, partial [Candidatus Pelagibacter sp.]|nr:hypothetical protein [Candidatus Pelagibacter sp.]
MNSETYSEEYKKLKNINSIKIIFLVSIGIFIFKWLFSYYFFQDDISIKIIFDSPSDGYFFYIYTEALSSLNFNNSYDPNIKNLQNLPLPFFATLISSVLLKLFGFYAILITELLFIFLFILIFFFIFRKLDFKRNFSILLALTLLSIPTIINFFDLNSFQYFNSLDNIFGLRFTRPLVVNNFLYIFILHLIYLDREKTFNFKNFIIFGLILSFSFTSFYYFFILQIITLLIYLLSKFRLFYLIKLRNIQFYMVSLLVFLVASAPFIYFLITSEADYKERLYLMDIDINKKKILFEHLFDRLISLKFILVFLVITSLNIANNMLQIKNANKINIFYFLFIASILSPFIFIVLTSKVSLIYHFTNLIVLSIFYYFFFFIANLFNRFKKLQNNKVIISSIIFLIFFYNFNVYQNFKVKKLNDDYTKYRTGIFNATQVLKRIGREEVKLLTFDSRLMVWAILNNVKQINVLSGQLVPKKHSMIENDLINNFKFLKLDVENFLNFFENKETEWRLFNPNTQLFFWGRYTASTLKTYKDSKDFEQNELDKIAKTTPLNVQSIAIPKGEFERL